MRRPLLLLVAAACAALPACGSDSAGLEALRADPMATVEVPSARSEVANELEGGGPKGVSAQLVRAFTPRRAGAEQVRAELEAAAEAEGWRPADSSRLTTSFRKDLEGRGATILLAVVPSQEVVLMTMSTTP